MNPYEILGLDRNAKPEEIKAALRAKMKASHPDMAGGSNEAAIEVNQAYAILANPVRRAKYDTDGVTEEPPSIQKRAIKEIQAAIVMALERHDYAHEDLIERIMGGTKVRTNEIKNRKIEHFNVIKKWQKHLKRITRKGGTENPIATAIEDQIQLAKIRIAVCDDEILLMDAIILELDNYRWEFESKQQNQSVSVAGYKFKIGTNP